MKTAKFIGYICLIAMTIGLLNGFINGDFINEGKQLLSNHWGIMSLIDLYTGFILFSIWIFYREKNTFTAVVWTFFMLILGFFTASLYLLVCIYKSKDLESVLLGKHKK